LTELRKTEERQLVEIDYTNHRGERRSRIILPMRFDFIVTEWHPDPPEGQWICWAQDQKDGAVKAFAMSGLHGWKEVVR